MLKPLKIAETIAEKTTGLLDGHRAPLLALAWVLANVVVGWIGVKAGHRTVGALTAGALDGAILSAIVLVKASARLEATVTGLLSGFGLDSITNSGRTIASFVHGVHDALESIVNASTEAMEAGHHAELELMIMRGIWMAIIVMLLALLVKWGQTPAAVSMDTPMSSRGPVPVQAEIARGHAA